MPSLLVISYWKFNDMNAITNLSKKELQYILEIIHNISTI